MSFDDFFKKATNSENSPFPFQKKYALTPSLPHMVRVPTGLGKTAMAVLGWIWRRFFAETSVRKETPRRLVFCLPMRVLVEQTRDSINTWLKHLSLSNQVEVHVLMGGEDFREWDLYPEKEAILVGTQDMLLSRTLNRGYGMSRYRWPIQFGLLNNDCLWVFDEVQLMDVGASTSAQLEGFRRKLETLKAVECVWMSATLDQNWLYTIDIDPKWLGDPFELSETDKSITVVKDRYDSVKPLEKSPATMGHTKLVAEQIRQNHQPGTCTLAVFNTVDRAGEVYGEIKKIIKKRGEGPSPILIHSRFRPADRERNMKKLLDRSSETGIIAVTTQVVEAGVDISAKTLFTELAPWASLVQRFGRCNRKGEFNPTKDARVIWFDWEEKDKEKLARPYPVEELENARKHLSQLTNVGPASLDIIQGEMSLEVDHVIRRRDFIDLFDTTPDLAGNDIDISRFIRSGEELDVQVFWRDIPEEVKHPGPEKEEGKSPRREELCNVPFYKFRDFVKKKVKEKGKERNKRVWKWDPLNSQWQRVYPRNENEIYPGQMFLVHSRDGGYSSETGWNLKSKTAVDPVKGESSEEMEGYDRDGGSTVSVWQTIGEHTDEVVRELERILEKLSVSEMWKKTLLEAARWHDLGKAHEVFQNAVKREERPGPYSARIDIAKAPRGFWQNYERRHFRHELASALAMLQLGMDDLSVYLAAAHHGKVRLSIRSLPEEDKPDDDPSRLFARGIWDGDSLPQVDLGGGVTVPAATLSLECMQLGRSKNGEPSWSERMLKLRDRYGPFQIAYLEALLRAADMRASKYAGQNREPKQEPSK